MGTLEFPPGAESGTVSLLFLHYLGFPENFMKSLTVFDPAAADNTGAGDSTPVPELIRFASDAEWLKRKGGAVERWNLVSDPMEFALNHRV